MRALKKEEFSSCWFFVWSNKFGNVCWQIFPTILYSDNNGKYILPNQYEITIGRSFPKGLIQSA